MKSNLLFSMLLLFCMGLVSTVAYAQIQDNVIDDPGDIAIVSYYSPGQPSGGISFALLDNCPNGTSIVFTDEEWTGSSFVTATGEGDITWTNNTGSQIIKGSVVHIQSTSSPSAFNTIICNKGSATMTDSGFGCTNNDQVYAYIGSRSSVTAWLTAYGGLTIVPSLPALPAVMPPGLTNGTNAIITATGGRYTGSTTCNGTVIDCAQMINNSANWTFNNSYTYPTDVVQLFNFNAVVCTTPTAYTLTGGGTHCAGGAGVAVGLSNSETGVSYQLKDGASDIGTAVSGTGSAISFGNQTTATT